MSEKKKPGLLGYAAVMGVIIFISKILGLVRDVMVARLYGTGMEAVAYETASRLPVLIFDFVIGGVVTSAFIPVFNSLMVKKGKKDALDFANSYVNFILILTAAISVLGLLFANQLVRFLAPDINAETAALAVKLTRIMFPMIIFTGLAFSFVGILQSMGEYNIPALISLVSNLIMVGYLFTINGLFGIIGLSVAMLLGWAAQAAIQIPKIHSLGYRYSPRLPKLDESLRRSIKSALPILIGTWTTPVCNLINTRLASSLDEGRAITALGYANRFYTIIVGLFSFVATNLLFPFFSRAEALGDRDESSRLIKTSSKGLIYIISPITVGVVLLSRPLISLVYERGSFTASDTALTSTALSCYCVGMIFMAVNEVLVKSLFAAEKAKVPMISSVCAMVFNVAVIVLFGEYLGIGGIALVSGCATLVNFLINAVIVGKLGICKFVPKDFLDVFKSIISAAAMIPVIWLIKNNVESNLIELLASAVCGAIVYFAVSILLRSEEPKHILKIIKNKKK